MANEILLTKEGYEKMKADLEHLKTSERQRIADNIREAKSHGDLRENAMYHEAKLNQERLESRIADMERTLEYATVVEDDDTPEGAAKLGAKVKLKDLNFNDELTVTLAGEYEAEDDMDAISISSPLGAALVGKMPGDKLTVEAPAGTLEYEVLAVD